MREHWSAPSECSGARVDRGEVSIEFAQSAMMHDLAEFKRWWTARTDLPAHLPSIEEWRAEFLAWSLKRSPITPTKEPTP